MKIEGEAVVLRIYIGESDTLRIYIGESDTWHGKPLHMAILLMAREKGMAGATVFKGVEGFGANSRIHTSNLLRLSGGQRGAHPRDPSVAGRDDPRRPDHDAPHRGDQVRGGPQAGSRFAVRRAA